MIDRVRDARYLVIEKVARIYITFIISPIKYKLEAVYQVCNCCRAISVSRWNIKWNKKNQCGNFQIKGYAAGSSSYPNPYLD